MAKVVRGMGIRWIIVQLLKGVSKMPEIKSIKRFIRSPLERESLLFDDKVKLKTDDVLVELEKKGCITSNTEDWFVDDNNVCDIFELSDEFSFVSLETESENLK